MATELIVKAKRLGTIREVMRFLYDIENVYTNMYLFDFISSKDNEDKIRLFLEKFPNLKEKLDFPWHGTDKTFQHYFGEYPFPEHEETEKRFLLFHLLKREIADFIVPTDRLTISKINIQSPGYWEFLGSLNPLQQIREYFNDRHERQKDSLYRNRQEEELRNLIILEKKVDILRKVGCDEAEIRPFIKKVIIEPLHLLTMHQDSGLIEGVE